MDIHLDEIKNKLFFYQREKSDRYEQNECAYITKKYDTLFLNELKITEIIKNNPLLSYSYDLMIDFKKVTLAECSENFLNMNENTNLDEKYVIISYKKRDILDFSTFLYSIDNHCYFLSTLLETYRELLGNLLRLRELGICFYNISSNNIYYTYDGNSILKNIENCILLKNLDIDYFSELLKYNDNFVSSPIEIHVLFFLLNNEIETLSAELIDTIIENFVSNVKIFPLFSSDYRENYIKDAKDFLYEFIGKPKKYIMEIMVSYVKTWDCYSLSFLFAYLVANVLRVFSLKGTFMSKFLSLLIKCLHPNPSKRENIQTILHKFEDILYKNADWHFVSQMNREKLIRLYHILQKE
jgi:hypothetical protein